MSTSLYHRLRLHISRLFRVCFYSRTYGKEYFFYSGASHSFVAASCVNKLGLKVETLEESLHVNSPLGTKMRIDQICQDYELEISGILLTMDLRVMDMSKFDVILGKDWLTAHRVIIDCDRKRVTAYTPGASLFIFRGDKHDALP